MGSLLGLRRILGLLGVLCLGSAAWLLLPRASPDAAANRRAVRIVVVDASGSVRRTRPGWRGWVRRVLEDEAREAAERDELFGVVSFAVQAGASFAVQEPDVFLQRLRGRGGPPFDPSAISGGDEASELARAIEVACELADGPGLGLAQLVILGAGAYTGAAPYAGLARARDLGASVVLRSPLQPELADLALRELRLPSSIEAGAPLLGRARLEFLPGGATPEEAWLEVELENAGQVQGLKVPLQLPAAGGAFEVSLPCGAAGFGRTQVRVRARVAPGPDPVPENDELSEACLAAGELVLGVVADVERLGAARAWLTPSGSSALPGLQFVFVTPDELPGVLRELDGLVSFDVSLRDLPALLLEDFVRQGGGGWLATSGWRLLEDWVPGGVASGLGAILPLEPAPLDRGPRDVVLLVDGSGSMEGRPFDTVRSACLDLVAAALPSDEVSLRFFTGRLEEARAIKPRSAPGEVGEVDEGDEGGDARAAAAARRLLDLRVPTGETHILLSLEQFAETRPGTEREALVLLLTDGREREAQPDLAGRARRVLQTYAEVDAQLRVIAVGDDADLGFLSHLTRTGEEVARPEGLDDLRALFRREISGAQWRADDALELRRAPVASDSLVAEIQDDESPPPLPALERLVKNVLRTAAEAMWIDDGDEPALGVQRVGLGRTALFGSHPDAGWAAAFGGRPGRGEPAVFGPLLRWLGRGTERREAGPRLERSGAGLELVGLEPGWPARVTGRVVDARSGAELARLEFAPPATGDPRGRRAAALGTLERALATGPHAAPALLVLERPDGPEQGPEQGPGQGLWIEPLPPRPAREFAGREATLDLPAALAGPQVPERTSRGQEPHRYGPRLLLLGLLMVLLAALLPVRPGAP